LSPSDGSIARWIGRRLQREEGVVAVLAALLLIVLFAAVAFAVDLSRLRHERHVVQTAVDFAALSAAGLLPAEGPLEGGLAEQMAIDVALDNAPGITAADVDVSFRCVVVNQPVNQPWNSPDLDFACNQAGGGTFSSFIGPGGWRIRGARAFHVCVPDAGDKCNAIVVRSSNDVQYFFAPVIGHNVGNTGSVAGAACKGFCGQPSKPLDIVMVLDRTASMTQGEIDQLKAAASGIVAPSGGAFDPTLHKVGLILLPYSDPGTPPGNLAGGFPEVGCRTARNQFYWDNPGATHSWRPVNPGNGLPNVNPIPPEWEPPETTFVGGNDWNSSPWGVMGLTSDYAQLSSTINCIERAPNGLDGDPDNNGNDNSAVWVDNPGAPATYQARGGGHTNYSDPMWAARNMLARSDPNIEDVVIFFGDGQANQPNDGSSTSGALNPCERSVRAAQDVKDDGVFVYTIAYGVGNIQCDEDDTGVWRNRGATNMFAAMASQPSDDTNPGGCNAAGENTDEDFYFCTAAASDLDDVFVQIATQLVQRARLIEFD
jgi:hypothetical protein